MTFSLFFPNGEGCGLFFDEGIELAIRTSSVQMEWIPLVFIYPSLYTLPDNLIPIGNLSDFILRGYRLEMDGLIHHMDNLSRDYSFTICVHQQPEFNGSDYVQFRWLQTNQFISTINSRCLWSLDNVKIDFVDSDDLRCSMHDTSFENTSFA